MNSELKKVVFLDRDGVLNRTMIRGDTTYPPASLNELEILPGVPEALRQLSEHGFALVVVTNQPDVARGRQSRERVEEINDYLRSELPLLDVLTCYHDNGHKCLCRKPRPGLLIEAAGRWNLDLRTGVMVGDRWSDVVAGQAAGCRSVLIETPFSERWRCQPDEIVSDLLAAAAWIIPSLVGETV